VPPLPVAPPAPVVPPAPVDPALPLAPALPLDPPAPALPLDPPPDPPPHAPPPIAAAATRIQSELFNRIGDRISAFRIVDLQAARHRENALGFSAVQDAATRFARSKNGSNNHLVRHDL